MWADVLSQGVMRIGIWRERGLRPAKRRHVRACTAYPRLRFVAPEAWMPERMFGRDDRELGGLRA